MKRTRRIRKEAIRRSKSWWYSDNCINHSNQVGLIRMDFPQVFVLIRNYHENYYCTFEKFKNGVAEVNFFRPLDRETADIDEILTDAWNLLAMVEEEDILAQEYEMSAGIIYNEYNQES